MPGGRWLTSKIGSSAPRWSWLADVAVPACLVNRIYAYAVGRVPTKSETEWLNSDLKKEFAADGYRLKPLMRRIVTSDVFFRVVVPESEAKPVRSASVQGVGQ